MLEEIGRGDINAFTATINAVSINTSAAAAARICAVLSGENRECKTTAFDGQPMDDPSRSRFKRMVPRVSLK